MSPKGVMEPLAAVGAGDICTIARLPAEVPVKVTAVTVADRFRADVGTTVLPCRPPRGNRYEAEVRRENADKRAVAKRCIRRGVVDFGIRRQTGSL